MPDDKKLQWGVKLAANPLFDNGVILSVDSPDDTHNQQTIDSTESLISFLTNHSSNISYENIDPNRAEIIIDALATIATECKNNKQFTQQFSIGNLIGLLGNALKHAQQTEPQQTGCWPCF